MKTNRKLDLILFWYRLNDGLSKHVFIILQRWSKHRQKLIIGRSKFQLFDSSCIIHLENYISQGGFFFVTFLRVILFSENFKENFLWRQKWFFFRPLDGATFFIPMARMIFKKKLPTLPPWKSNGASLNYVSYGRRLSSLINLYLNSQIPSGNIMSMYRACRQFNWQ